MNKYNNLSMSCVTSSSEINLVEQVPLRLLASLSASAALSMLAFSSGLLKSEAATTAITFYV